MSDPTRWRDAGSDAPEHLRELMRAVPRTSPMAAADRARAAATIAKLASKPVAATLVGTLWAKVAVVTVGTAMAVVSVPIARRVIESRASTKTASAMVHTTRAHASHDEQTRHAQGPLAEVAAPVPQPAETVTTRDDVAPAIARGEAAPTRGTTRGHAAMHGAGTTEVLGTTPRIDTRATAGTVAAARVDTVASAPANDDDDENPLARESGEIDRARAMLGHDPAGALAVVEAPGAFGATHSSLAEEGRFIAITALHRLGRDDEARARASALASDDPASPYTARAARMLGQR